MKTLKKVSVDLVLVETMPEVYEPNIIYYSEQYHGSGHLCLCGCGQKVYIPIMQGEWSLIQNDGKVTIAPSLAHRFECKSHYIITNGVANFV